MKLKILKWIILILGTFLAVEITGVKFSPTQGPSMFPTIHSGDFILEVRPWFGVYRQDLIVVLIDKNIHIVKRIIGMPGDIINFSRTTIFVNDKALYEPYLYADFIYPVREIKLKNDEFFILGDNRSMSHDSLSFGPIHKDQIISKVITVLD